MSAYVYIVAGEDRHVVAACEGPLSDAITCHDAACGGTAMLLWAESAPDIATAQRLVPLIEGLDDAAYADLLGGATEAMSLLRET